MPVILEIGPGRGSLTDHLLTKAERIIAVEIDTVLVQYLRSKYRDQPRLEIMESDVLKADLAQWGPVTVAGNLPYYITSPIVEKVLSLGPLVASAVFLVQKEVAERMTASPNSRDYGYLSVATQYQAEAKMLFTVPPGAFRPPPKVDSAVVRLIPRAGAGSPDTAPFLRFAGYCFRHKRKTLRNNLLGIYPKEALERLPEAGLRAEQLSIPQLQDLQNRLKAITATSDYASENSIKPERLDRFCWQPDEIVVLKKSGESMDASGSIPAKPGTGVALKSNSKDTDHGQN